MLVPRSFTATAAEREAVEKLIGKHTEDGVASVTRNEPGETGALRVEIAGAAWLVSEDGQTKKVSA